MIGLDIRVDHGFSQCENGVFVIYDRINRAQSWRPENFEGLLTFFFFSCYYLLGEVWGYYKPLLAKAFF